MLFVYSSLEIDALFYQPEKGRLTQSRQSSSSAPLPVSLRLRVIKCRFQV